MFRFFLAHSVAIISSEKKYRYLSCLLFLFSSFSCSRKSKTEYLLHCNGKIQRTGKIDWDLLLELAFYLPDNLPGNVCSQLPKSVRSGLIPKYSLGTFRAHGHPASVRSYSLRKSFLHFGRVKPSKSRKLQS